jgi:hypothetical protein
MHFLTILRATTHQLTWSLFDSRFASPGIVLNRSWAPKSSPSRQPSRKGCTAHEQAQRPPPLQVSLHACARIASSVTGSGACGGQMADSSVRRSAALYQAVGRRTPHVLLPFCFSPTFDLTAVVKVLVRYSSAPFCVWFPLCVRVHGATLGNEGPFSFVLRAS